MAVACKASINPVTLNGSKISNPSCVVKDALSEVFSVVISTLSINMSNRPALIALKFLIIAESFPP